jgi:ABC-type Co2+ transport system permease subunit
MHIAEGVLSAPVLITGAVVAAAGVAYGLKKIPANELGSLINWHHSLIVSARNRRKKSELIIC